MTSEIRVLGVHSSTAQDGEYTNPDLPMSATVWVRDLSRLSKWLATPPQILELRKLQHVTFMLVLARGLVLLLRSLRRRLRVDATAEADRTSRSVVVQVSELEQSDAKCSIPYLGLTSREILSRAKEHTAPRTHPPITDGRLDSLKELQEKLRSLYEIQGIEGEAGECFRREVLSMAAHLLHGSTANVSGVLSKHSRESMYIAVLTYTMLARDRNVHSPEILASDMPSPALKEACEHFGIKLVEVESMGSMGLLTVEATEEQITHSTIAIFARCPCTQLGTFDPIMELGNIARKHSVGLHCDATPSGFLLCGLKAAQIYKGKFDFDVAGVTSVSVESKHVKNISVFLSKDMPVYAPPNTCMQHTMGELAAAWGTMLHLGYDGYISSAVFHHNLKSKFEEEIKRLDGLNVVSEAGSLTVNITSALFDVEAIAQRLRGQGWDSEFSAKAQTLYFSVVNHSVESVEPWIAAFKQSIAALSS